MAYFCIIFVLNLAMFVVVMVHLRRIKQKNPHNNQYRSSLQDLRSIAGLTFLLGLTWGFAFFAWGPVKLAFMYLFCILNSLQGEKQYYIICFMYKVSIIQLEVYFFQCNNAITLSAWWKKGLFFLFSFSLRFFYFCFPLRSEGKCP